MANLDHEYTELIGKAVSSLLMRERSADDFKLRLKDLRFAMYGDIHEISNEVFDYSMEFIEMFVGWEL